MDPIIRSLLDTELYKFTMWQTMLHRPPQAQAQADYSFVCRNEPAYPLAELLDGVDAQLDHLCSLRFEPGELAYLGGLRYVKSDFVDFLRIFASSASSSPPVSRGRCCGSDPWDRRCTPWPSRSSCWRSSTSCTSAAS